MPNSFKHENNLIWLDMEMTGLSVIENVIIEIAVIVTDNNLNVLFESESYAINQPESELSKMDKWNMSAHTKSGLIERVRQSNYTLDFVEKQLLILLKQYSYKGKSPLCGNTVHQDRKFMSKYMPKLEEFFHYRNLDVSTFKEISRRWYPQIYSKLNKSNKHEALADIRESIQELIFYRENLLVPIATVNQDATV
ncbi:MAG: oligoribonuclease [Burkholderiales bacterium]|nr:oligoribonuclease [Burkholderiales bacterium]